MNVPESSQSSATISAEQQEPSRVGINGHSKRLLDVVGAMLGLLILLPAIAGVALLLWATQGRPILVKHKRVGKGGEPFGCFKFRTMVVDADRVLQEHLATSESARREWAETRKLKNDPRVTPLGYVLRKSSVDELPQLANVLRGEMSLIGPRPIVEAEIKMYGRAFQHYQLARPGLTGPWQISGRNDTGYVERVELDSDYVQNWSLARDLIILVKTVPVVIVGRGSY